MQFRIVEVQDESGAAGFKVEYSHRILAAFIPNHDDAVALAEKVMEPGDTLSDYHVDQIVQAGPFPKNLPLMFYFGTSDEAYQKRILDGRAVEPKS